MILIDILKVIFAIVFGLMLGFAAVIVYFLTYLFIN
jgi:hypothetical protein